LVRAHGPVVSRFVRYAYGNKALGRDDMEDEKEWLESTDSGEWFGVRDSETRKMVGAHVLAGRWTPSRE